MCKGALVRQTIKLRVPSGVSQIACTYMFHIKVSSNASRQSQSIVDAYLETRLLTCDCAHQHIHPGFQEAVPHVVAVDCSKPEAPEGGHVIAPVRHDMHDGEVQSEGQCKPALKEQCVMSLCEHKWHAIAHYIRSRRAVGWLMCKRWVQLVSSQ